MKQLCPSKMKYSRDVDKNFQTFVCYSCPLINPSIRPYLLLFPTFLITFSNFLSQLSYTDSFVMNRKANYHAIDVIVFRIFKDLKHSMEYIQH